MTQQQERRMLVACLTLSLLGLVAWAWLVARAWRRMR